MPAHPTLEVLHTATGPDLPETPPLLFAHGLGHDASCWDDWRATAAEDGYPAYAVSLRGHGNSGGARQGPALGAQAGERRLRKVMVDDGGFTRFRRATETPFNLIFEASALTNLADLKT